MLPASARCTRSGNSARLAAHAASSARCQEWPAARAVAARARVVRFRRRGGECLGVGDASEMAGVSEQWLSFVLVAAGEEEEKKIVFLGFHGFYHGGPYSFIFFLVGRKC